jgi:transposase
VLWIVRTGSPWRDLPPTFGKRNLVFKRFRDWVKADVFKQMFDAVWDDLDMEYAMGRRHDRPRPPPRSGRNGGPQSQAIGRSRGGLTTKILALTDALGNLMRFVLLPGQR